MMLIEIAPGLDVETLKKNTGANFIVSPNLKEFQI